MVKFIPYRVCSGEENMKIDNGMLEDAIANKFEEPIFRLYGWAPACISLGKNQQDDFIDKNFLAKNNIDLVKRYTGGRALLHDDEITYSYVCPVGFLKHGENVTKSYVEISQILINVFEMLGINLKFGGAKPVNTKFDYCMLISTGADLCYEGKKLIGSAQCRKHGYILQHGSILYNYNRTLLEKIFHVNVDTSSITSVKEINPKITKQDIINSFNYFFMGK